VVADRCILLSYCCLLFDSLCAAKCLRQGINIKDCEPRTGGQVVAELWTESGSELEHPDDAKSIASAAASAGPRDGGCCHRVTIK